MERYLVGGAVRDKLLGRESSDRDYVVIGKSAQEMLQAGFKQVGADFPVFLDSNGDEHALARTERTSGMGHKSFYIDCGASVTLEEDLIRRDFTCNAIAYNEKSGAFIDPFGGEYDIQHKILRCVSEAFQEDPLRVYRAARFHATLDFTVSKETKELCKTMVAKGMLDHLSVERVVVEMRKAFQSDKPSTFFRFLHEINALKIHFPELAALEGQTQPIAHHPEGDSLEHTFQVLDYCRKITSDHTDLFAALTHDLGKGLTPKDMLPHHYGHEAAGVPLVEAMCDRLKLPASFRNVGRAVARFHMHVHKTKELNPKTFVKLLDRGLKSKSLVESLVTVSVADHMGRGPDRLLADYPQAEIFYKVMADIIDVKLSDLVPEEVYRGMSVGQIKNFMYKARINKAKQILRISHS